MESYVLTHAAICIQETWAETQPKKEVTLLILCAFVKVFSSPSLHPVILSSLAAAGQRCVSQGHDAGSVLLTGPASGTDTHILEFGFTCALGTLH